MNEMELILFNIIANVGSARSSFIEAISFAKEQDFKQARDKIIEGEEAFVEGHKAHMQLVSKEAAGEKVEFSLLLIHAEDQLMNAETFKILAKEFIDLYEKL